MMLEGPSNRIMIDQSTVTVIVLTIPNQCQHAFTYTFTVELGLEDIGGIRRATTVTPLDKATPTRQQRSD